MKPCRIAFFSILLILSGLIAAEAATPFTKPVRGRGPKKEKPATALEAVADTIWSPSPDSVAVAGFEKTLRSNRESMYISNRSASSISELAVTITYYDMDGRMLHKTSHVVAEVIPSGETRLVDVPSFDRQGLYYYHLSPVPTRATRATPFRVAVEVLYLLSPRKDD